MTISQDLIERVRQATGPDHKLDTDIWNALRPKGGWRARRHDPATFITASIDAAKAFGERMIPDAMLRAFDNPDDGSVRAEIIHGLVYGKGDHDTWPLAIVLATLIAIQSSETSNADRS